MSRRPLALLAVPVLALGLAACGGDDELTTELPRSTPELTVPSETTPAAPDATTTATTSTTETTPDAAADGGAAAAPAPAPAPAPAAPQEAPATGGQEPAGEAPSADTGGAAPGEFEDFCAQNPGAC